MLFKFLCTLWALTGTHSQVDHLAIYNNIIGNDSVPISLSAGDILACHLCNDFRPNITNKNCASTLFESSKSIDFITIVNQTMILTPNASDLGCCKQLTYTTCFSKTYQFEISARNISDSSLMMTKNFKVIVLPSMSKTEIETTIIAVCVLGSLIVYRVRLCIEKLHIRLRREIVHEYS